MGQYEQAIDRRERPGELKFELICVPTISRREL